MERQSAQGVFFHRSCFRCYHCNSQLKTGNYSYSHGSDGEKGRFYCTPHFKQLFLSNPEAVNYGRHKDGPTAASTAKKTSQHSVPSSDQVQQQDQSRKSEDQRKLQEDQKKLEDQRKLQEEQRKQQVDQKRSENSTAEAMQMKQTPKGCGKIVDRIKNWETGKVVPMDTTPPSIHNSKRMIVPQEDNGHGSKPLNVNEQEICNHEENTSKQDANKQHVSKQVVNKQEISKQDVSKQDVSICKQDVDKQDISKQVSKQDVSICKQDVNKQDISKQNVEVLRQGTTPASNLHDNSDEHSEDDEVLPLPSTVQRYHSTPEQTKQPSEQDEDATRRRSSRVISRDRIKLSKKYQTSMQLSCDEDTSRRPARRRRSIAGGARRGQKSIFRKADSDFELTDNKLQEHRKHYSRLLKVCMLASLSIVCVHVCHTSHAYKHNYMCTHTHTVCVHTPYRR